MDQVVVMPTGDDIFVTHYDTAGGHRLHEGDKVRLHWPDGSMDETIIHIDRKSPPFNYGGPIHQAPDDRAYVFMTFKGADIRVYLRWEPMIFVERLDV